MERVNVEERVERARTYFTSGYNCAQSVALTFTDLFDVDPNVISTISSSFGGGMGRLREVCGAVSGMAIIAGLIAPATDVTDRAAKSTNYTLVQSLAESFRVQNGSIVCRDLLGLSSHKEDPTPSARTAEYYKKRPCAELVADAARIVAESINSQI